MYNQNDWAGDPDELFVKGPAENSPPGTTTFSVDDAFSDADDIDPSLEFSSVAIRVDLARAASYSRESEELAVAEESLGVGATGDTRELPARSSSSVCGIPVTLPEPHQSAGIS
jgi:hypothetical protein